MRPLGILARGCPKDGGPHRNTAVLSRYPHLFFSRLEKNVKIQCQSTENVKENLAEFHG